MKRVIPALILILAILTFSACHKNSGPVFGVTPVVDVSEDSEIRVGVIFSGDEEVDNAYIQSHIQGIEAMRLALGLSEEQVQREFKVSVEDKEQIRRAVENCVLSGCKIIFGTEKEYAAVLAEYAREYPEVFFSNALTDRNNGTNFSGYTVDTYEVQYLSGIVAAMRTQTGAIGYVGYTAPEAIVGINAFAMGVERVNPEYRVYLCSVEERCSPERERSEAQALIDMGCDVIGQNTYSTQPQLVAEENEVWSCGFLTDMNSAAPDAHLQSAMVNWGSYYTKAVKETIEGTWQNENLSGGLTNGHVALSPVNHNCTRGTTAAVNEAKAELSAGKHIFTGELIDNEGNIVCPEGSYITYDQLTEGFDWYYRNIVDYKEGIVLQGTIPFFLSKIF